MSGEPVDEWRKRGRDKSTSSKHFRPQRHNLFNSQSQNMRSPVRTSSMHQPLSPTGPSAASYAQLSISPQPFIHFSASAGRHHHTSAGRVSRDGPSIILETLSKEQLHQLGQDLIEKGDNAGGYKEPGQRTDMSRVAPQLRSEEVEEAEGLCDIERVITGRKASKKHKSK